MSSYLLSGLEVLGVLFLVALNAFFVAAEFALVTVRWTRVEELVAEGRFGAVAVRQAIENVNDAIAASQVGITFASLALGWIGLGYLKSSGGADAQMVQSRSDERTVAATVTVLPFKSV